MSGACVERAILRWQSRFRRHFRERFIRLQHENKMLKLRQTDEVNNEQSLILQASCEQLKDQNNQLTNDLWSVFHYCPSSSRSRTSCHRPGWPIVRFSNWKRH